MLKGKSFILAFIIGMLLTGCTPKATPDETKTEVTISAASSMTESLLEIKEQFEKEYPSIAITFNFGGSGALRKQIEQGAPIDLFFFASKKDFELLNDRGMINKGKAILKNRLVIIASETAELKSLKDVVQQHKKLAIGTPEAVPAGTYAEEALRHMRMWDKLKDHLVYTKDVQQVRTFVETGAVAAGVVYLSDTVGLKKAMILEEVDPSFYSPIQYYMGIIKKNGEKEEAEETFYRFVQNKQSGEIFERHGFVREK